MSNLVCKHTHDYHIRLFLCGHLIFLSLVWLKKNEINDYRQNWKFFILSLYWSLLRELSKIRANLSTEDSVIKAVSLMTGGKAWYFDPCSLWPLSFAGFYCKCHSNLSTCVSLSFWINTTLLVCSLFEHCDVSYYFPPPLSVYWQMLSIKRYLIRLLGMN